MRALFKSNFYLIVVYIDSSIDNKGYFSVNSYNYGSGATAQGKKH